MFVALLLSGRVAAEIDGLRRALQPGLVERIPPHLTLIPPVNVAEEHLGEALALVRAASASCAPLRLGLGPVASFLPDAPVAYLTCTTPLERLETLRRALSKSPLAPPPARPDRPFVPHLTLTNRLDPSRAAAVLSTLAAYRAETTVEEVTLLIQEPSRAGHRWVPLFDSPLGGPAVLGRGGLELELTLSERLDPEAAAFARDAWQDYSRTTYGPQHQPDRPFVVVARQQGVPVAIASGELRGDTAELERLIVAAELRGLGIGGQLLGFVERLARDANCRRLRLRTIAGGRAEAFYGSHGYSRVALLPTWREGRDFALLERHLR